MKFAIVVLLVCAAVVSVRALEEERNDVKCEACKTVVHLIDHYLEEGKTVEEIERLLGKLCALLGPQYAKICTLVMDQGLEQLIKWIESMSPEEVCRLIRLCVQNVELDISKCTVCKLAVDAIMHFVQDPHTEQEIISFITRLCKLFPAYDSVCTQLVAYGVMELIELIKQYGDSAKVCGAIKLC